MEVYKLYLVTHKSGKKEEYSYSNAFSHNLWHDLFIVMNT